MSPNSLTMVAGADELHAAHDWQRRDRRGVRRGPLLDLFEALTILSTELFTAYTDTVLS
jgi:hypothetical protein